MYRNLKLMGVALAIHVLKSLHFGVQYKPGKHHVIICVSILFYSIYYFMGV